MQVFLMILLRLVPLPRLLERSDDLSPVRIKVLLLDFSGDFLGGGVLGFVSVEDC